MDRELIKGLVMLLIVATLMTFLLSLPFNRQGFFLNVSTELIGVIVAVGVVGWILDAREKARWKPVQRLVDQRLRMVAMELFSLLALWSPIKALVMERVNIGKLDEPIDASISGLLRAAKDAPKLDIERAILEAEQSDAVSLQQGVADFDTHLMQTFDQLERRLSPGQMATILSISHEMSVLYKKLAIQMAAPGFNMGIGHQFRTVFSHALDLELSTRAN